MFYKIIKKLNILTSKYLFKSLIVPIVENRKPRLLIDKDEVLGETMKELIKRMNRDYGTNYNLESVNCWDVCKCLGKEALSYFSQEDFMLSLEPSEGAVEVMEYLCCSDKYDVFIVTAGSTVEHQQVEQWVKKLFPFFNIKNLIFTSNKECVWGDVLLDDAEHNLESFKKIGIPVMYDRPHNQDAKGYIRVKNLYEFKHYVDSLFYPHSITSEKEKPIYKNANELT